MRAAFVLGLLLHAGSALGQSRNNTNEPDEIVVSARGRASGRFVAPRSVWVVERRTMQSLQPRNIPEALREIPGVSTQTTNRGAGAPIMRGLIGPRNLVLVDGVRLNRSTWRNGPLQYLAALDPWAFEQIEVLSGPGSVLYGSDALGGVVQLSSAGVPTVPWAARLMMRFRSADLAVESAADAAMVNTAWGARAGVSLARFGALRTGGGTMVPASEYHSFGARLQTWSFLTEEMTLSFATMLGGVRDAGRVDLLGTGRVTRFDNTEMMTRAELRYRPRHGLMTELRAFIAWSFEDDRSRQANCRTSGGIVVDARSCALELSSTVQRTRWDQTSVHAPSMRVTAQLGRERDFLRATVGADAAVDFAQSSARTVTYPEPARTVAGAFQNGTVGFTGGLFAQGDMSVWRNWAQELTASAGVRLAMVSGFAPNVPVVRQVSYTMPGFAAQASLGYSWRRWLYAWLGYSQGFRAPGLQETSYIGAEGGAYQIPNAALGPEQSHSVETGVRFRSSGIQAELMMYGQWLNGLIIRQVVPTAEWMALGVSSSEVGSVSVVRNMNASVGRYLGGELAARVEPITGLAVWARAGVVFGSVWDQTGMEEPAPRVPPMLGSMGVRYTRERWHIELFSRWALPQDRLAGSDKRDLRICEDRNRPGVLLDPCPGTNGWITLNLRGGVQLLQRLRADLVFENITDSRYRYHGSGVDEPGIGGTVMLSGNY